MARKLFFNGALLLTDAVFVSNLFSSFNLRSEFPVTWNSCLSASGGPNLEYPQTTRTSRKYFTEGYKGTLNWAPIIPRSECIFGWTKIHSGLMECCDRHSNSPPHKSFSQYKKFSAYIETADIEILSHACTERCSMLHFNKWRRNLQLELKLSSLAYKIKIIYWNTRMKQALI